MTIIIDTDPGIDDMLALMLLLATPKKTEELRMISLSFGNCSLRATLVNVLSLFHVLGQDAAYRTKKGLPPFTDQKPIISLGSAATIDNRAPADATDVHGNDGLGGSHALYPEYTCPPNWLEYFDDPQKEVPDDLPFVPNHKPSYEAILDVLRTEPENSVTLIAVGPLTNVARAAESDPAAFSRVKQVLSMGGAVRHTGNVTPEAEFNVYADPIAAARVYALTSAKPNEVLPPHSPAALSSLAKPLNLIIFPLDITERHGLHKDEADAILDKAITKNEADPMPKWVKIWIDLSFKNMQRLTGEESATISLHDPLTAAYAVSRDHRDWKIHYEDVRVESQGTWALGKTVVDSRGRARLESNPHDYQKWLTVGSGNNVGVVTESPYPFFGKYILDVILAGLE